MGDRHKTEPTSVFYCPFCGFDLREAKNDGHVPPDLLAFQSYHSELLRGSALGPQGSSSLKYFTFLAHVLTLLASQRERMRRFCELTSEASGIAITDIKFEPDMPVYFDALGIPERTRLLQAAAWLFADWPARLRSLMILGKLRYSDLILELDDAPEWFLSAIRRPERYRVSLLPGQRAFRGNNECTSEDGFPHPAISEPEALQTPHDETLALSDHLALSKASGK